MKASAASAIGQYEKSVAALADYARTVELGLGVCLRAVDPKGAQAGTGPTLPEDSLVHAVVFGSDQGLVGRFNEVVVDHAMAQLGELPAQAQVWAVGERVRARLLDAGLPPVGSFPVPGSVELITRLVGQILLRVQVSDGTGGGEPQAGTLRLFYNRPSGASYEPVSQRLLPLDEYWQRDLARRPWPTARSFTPLPEVLGPRAPVRLAVPRQRRVLGQRERQSACRHAARRSQHRRVAHRSERQVPSHPTEWHRRRIVRRHCRVRRDGAARMTRLDDAACSVTYRWAGPGALPSFTVHQRGALHGDAEFCHLQLHRP